MAARRKIFFSLAVLALSAIAARHVYLAGPGGEKYRLEAEKISRFEGVLSAIRGRIFTAEGELAAWSERCYDLFWRASAADGDGRRTEALRRVLLDKLFGADGDSARTLTPGAPVKYDLTMRELEIADALAQEYPELDIQLRWERRHGAGTPFCGEVRQENGMEIGFSGMEAEFDALLRGVPGRYSVMLDRRGRWLDATFRIVTQPRPGRDLFLPGTEPDPEDAHD